MPVERLGVSLSEAVTLMGGTAAGAARRRARQLGLSEAEYAAKIDAGLKWCTSCQDWHPATAFAIDRSRGDGLHAHCSESRGRRARGAYTPRPRPAPGRRFVPARDDDRLQARRRVNHLVDVGVLPDPDDVPCTDCGHRGDGPRHEYDHFKGYAAEHHEDVEVVCAPCHHRRERRRG